MQHAALLHMYHFAIGPSVRRFPYPDGRFLIRDAYGAFDCALNKTKNKNKKVASRCHLPVHFDPDGTVPIVIHSSLFLLIFQLIALSVITRGPQKRCITRVSRGNSYQIRARRVGRGDAKRQALTYDFILTPSALPTPHTRFKRRAENNIRNGQGVLRRANYIWISPGIK